MDQIYKEQAEANEILQKEIERLKAESQQYYKDFKECYMDLGEMRGERDEWKRRAIDQSETNCHVCGALPEAPEWLID